MASCWGICSDAAKKKETHAVGFKFLWSHSLYFDGRRSLKLILTGRPDAYIV
jgi:hypothetical protein